MNKCPKIDDLVANFSNDTNSLEKDAFELHLADCGECRHQMALLATERSSGIEAYSVPNSLRERVSNLPANRAGSASQAKRPLLILTDWLRTNPLQTAFAAFAILIVGFVGSIAFREQNPAKSADVYRSGDATENSVKLIFPAADTTVSGENIEFRWLETTGAKSYVLIISDTKGDIIKRFSTERPEFKSPAAEIGLSSNVTYFWRVEARFNDGKIFESAHQKFTFIN